MLGTERLILRRWQDKDLEPFAKINADPRVMEFFPSCLTEEETQKFISKSEDKFIINGFGWWVAEIKENSKFIGFIGLNIPDFTASFTPCVEIGWRMAANHWGNGYATEGAKAVLDYGFNKAGLNEILSWTYEGNARSINVMKKIGMAHDASGDFEHPVLPEGHWLRKHVLYRIRKGDTL